MSEIKSPVSSGTNRRQLLTRAGLAGAAALGTGLLGMGTTPEVDAALPVAYGPKHHRFLVNDLDILNFALNLEYLEAEFYQRAAFGTGLSDADVTGTGTPGTVVADNAATGVPFVTPAFKQYATEIAGDELNHVLFLRKVLGKHAVARPAINFTDTFTNAAIAAGVITAGQTFDPFANEDNFLLGSYIFEDVGVTAYHGGAPYIRNSTYLNAAAGILAVEAYHAGEIRTILFQLGQTTPALITAANDISNLRNAASAAFDGVTPTDQGITLPTSTGGTAANIIPTDGNSLAFARSFGSVLNIVYLNTTATPTPGGFFPAGLNGRIK